MAVSENEKTEVAMRRGIAAGQEPGETEIDLMELFYRLLEKAKYIIATALLGAILAGLYTHFMVTPLYRSSAKLLVLNSKETINMANLQIGAALASDYIEVFKNWHVHQTVIDELDLPYSTGQISGMINASVANNSRLITITVTSPDPQEARDIAMCYLRVAQEFIASKMETDMPNVFEEARVPTAPVSPNLKKNILMGFLLGAVLACGIVVLLFMVDDRIRSAEQLEKHLHLPTLGMMPVQAHQGARVHRQKSGKGGARK